MPLRAASNTRIRIDTTGTPQVSSFSLPPYNPYVVYKLIINVRYMAKIFIIGGSRFVGPLLIEQCTRRAHTVTVFNRGLIQSTYPKGVRFVAGDRSNGFQGIVEHFDVVIDTSAYAGNQTAKAMKELDFDFFIHFSTAAVYRKTEMFPLVESSELGEWPLWGNYNRGKIECENVLAARGTTCASLRPVYILGPRNYVDREHFIYSRIRSGREIILPGNGEAIAQFVFADEVARSLVYLAENKIAGAFNCAGDNGITLRGLVREMAKIAGKEAIIGFNPRADGAGHRLNEFPFANEHFFCSNEKLRSLGLSFIPLIEGLQRDYDAYYQHIQ